jgi:hypothetical protein
LLQKTSAAAWFLRSGIQEPNGGVARYHRTDLGRNLPISTEITGYAASALLYLGERDAARAAADYLVGMWDARAEAMPFEEGKPAYSYFFDNGIIIRALVGIVRKHGSREYYDMATAIGRHMTRDFDNVRDFHPILSLPDKKPVERDALRWSRAQGCYQLKAAMAWHDLAELTGDVGFFVPYERMLQYSLDTWRDFLPGHTERAKVMDRLHAFCYFLEGMLPRCHEPRCRLALHDGIEQAAALAREIAPEFARSDVWAQLLRIRLYMDSLCILPLDREAAAYEAEQLRQFETPDGGFRFGRRNGEWLPYINPVSTAFATQALTMWSGDPANICDLI